MLILTRRVGEEIWAGTMRIVVLGIKGKQVRIGIQAGDDVKIDRSEVAKRELASVNIHGVTIEFDAGDAAQEDHS